MKEISEMTTEEMAQELAAARKVLNPRLWDRALSNKWHRAIPKLYDAFQVLRDFVEEEAGQQYAVTEVSDSSFTFSPM